MPRKNVRLLGGQPLIAYSVRAALGAAAITDVVVSTDDDEIAVAAELAGAEVPFRRPAELAQDETPMIDTVLHAIDALAELGRRYDLVCLLQPTSPMRLSSDIDRAVALMDAQAADTVFSALPVPAEHHPYWTWLVQPDGTLSSLVAGDPPPRRQDLPPAVHREGSVYVATVALVEARRSLYGNRVVAFEIDPARSVNIDTPDDWARAERLIAASQGR